MRTALAVVAALCLAAIPAGGVGCGGETAADFDTFSSYGFSFDYPKRLTVYYEERANETGIVEASTTTAPGDECELFRVVWRGNASEKWEIPQLTAILDGLFQSLEQFGDYERDEPQATIHGEQYVLYQYYTRHPYSATEEEYMEYGVAGAFYCKENQRLYMLQMECNTNGGKLGTVERFKQYLGSFVCYDPG